MAKKYERPLHAFVRLHRELEVLEHAMVLEHSRLLKLAADSGVRDLRFGEACEIDGLAEERGSGIRSRLARDHIHHGGFACAVGPDHATQLTGLDGQRELVERLEAVKAHGDVLEIEDRPVGRIDAFRDDAAYPGSRRLSDTGSLAHVRFPIFLMAPITPAGKNSVTRMKSMPRKNSQYSGNDCVKKLLAALTRPAPS